MAHEWVKLASGRWQCRYNEACSCEDRKCHKCGWNPTVDNKRKQKQQRRFPNASKEERN